MKKITYIMTFAVLLAASCQKNEADQEPAHDNPEHVKVLTVGVDDEQQTKVGFDENNSFYWHTGDQIGVLTSGGLKAMTLDGQYHKKATGVFYGDFQEDIGEYVVYPYGEHIFENGLLTYVLPSSYTYTSIDADANSFNPPMLGRINGTAAQLKHLASFFKITVTNIPAGGDDMKLIFTADRRITGEFTTDLAAETPVITTDDSAGNTVTINFSNTLAGATGTFYIPAPLGTYGSITAEVKAGEILLSSKTWTEPAATVMAEIFVDRDEYRAVV